MTTEQIREAERLIDDAISGPLKPDDTRRTVSNMAAREALRALSARFWLVPKDAPSLVLGHDSRGRPVVVNEDGMPAGVYVLVGEK